ncbi:MAG: pyrroline-5-carboxylate reductase [Clostridium sp.]
MKPAFKRNKEEKKTDGGERRMKKIGFIGMGNMGYAILKGLLQVFDKTELILTDANQERAEAVSQETGVEAAGDNQSCASQAEFVVLAVKPQFYHMVLDDVKDIIKKEQIIISIAPSVTIADLKAALGQDKRIVRAMPNTPALVGMGVTGVCYDRKEFTQEEEAVIRTFFESFGTMELVEERLINAVVCASGSSPAYVYMFIEALADSAVKYGLPRDTAYRMAAQAVMGSAKMVLETGEHPGTLKDRVCSPGGTTIAAVSALEEHGFRSAVIKAADACYEKCLNMK